MSTSGPTVGQIVSGFTVVQIPAVFTAAPIVGLPDTTGVPDNYYLAVVGGVPVWQCIQQAHICPDFAITSFNGPANLVRVGSQLVNPAFTAAYNLTPTTATLTDTEGTPPKDVSGTPTAFTADNTYQKLVVNQSVTWTLTAGDGTGTDNDNETTTWAPDVFWGPAPDGLSTEADIEGLPNSALDTNRNRTFTITVGPGEHAYFAAPLSYGTPTFTVGGFPGGFIEQVASVNVTNSEGITLAYYLWKSVNPNLGTITVVVS